MLRFSTGLVNSIARTASWKASLTSSFLLLYTGAQPATADMAATGTLLAAFSVDADDSTVLTLEDAATVGAIQKTASETWEANGLAAGVAGWFRWHKLSTDMAGTKAAALTVSTTLLRMDGSVAASGADLNLPNTTIAVSAPQRVLTFTFTVPLART